MKKLTKGALVGVMLVGALGALGLARLHAPNAASYLHGSERTGIPVSVFVRVGDQASSYAVPNVLELAGQLVDRLAIDVHVLPSNGARDKGDDALALCAAAQGGTGALRFLACRQGSPQGNDDWAACADAAALERRALGECANGALGKELAAKAIAAAAERGVTETPAFVIGKKAPVLELTRAALKRAACDAVTPVPVICSAASANAAVGFPIVVLTDARCADCRAPFWFRRMQMLFPAADVRVVDVQSAAGRAQYDALSAGLLPAVAFDARVANDPNFARVRRELVKSADGYFLAPATVHPAFDPTKG